MSKPIKKLLLVIVLCSCVAIFLLYLFPIPLFKKSFRQNLFEDLLRYALSCVASVCLVVYLDIKLFSKPKSWFALLPCLLIAINNFPFISYFNGNMQFVKKEFLDILLFALYCMCVGLFEECIFRGIVFSVFAERLPNDKKGFLLAYFISSVCFGLAHLFNLFSGAGVIATLLQVGYTTLTGGLFAFVLIQTKNLLCCGFLHGIYNFCGLLLSEQGLGSGVVFDTGTIIMMACVSVLVGVYVLYSLFRYPEEERKILYKKLSIDETAL